MLPIRVGERKQGYLSLQRLRVKQLLCPLSKSKIKLFHTALRQVSPNEVREHLAFKTEFLLRPFSLFETHFP